MDDLTDKFINHFTQFGLDRMKYIRIDRGQSPEFISESEKEMMNFYQADMLIVKDNIEVLYIYETYISDTSNTSNTSNTSESSAEAN